ncbi:MAG: hypothetical protein K2M08_06805 [Anaeroplasmataceae bacterium]|nr:hypothetical protein [Anaeroplasmataceae bacterium]
MVILTKDDLSTIERLLYNKARDIDVSIYNALQDETYKDFILDSLTLYFTKDGGIGNALEIDNYNPNASVYQTYEALRILSALNFDKHYDHELYIQILNKIGNYLFNRCPIENGLWNPLVETNDDYAHSEEYSYMKNPFSIWGVHPTVAILGYILELMPESKAYYKKALKQIGYIFAYLDNDDVWTNYTFTSFSALYASLKKIGLFPLECKKIEERMKKEALKQLADDTLNFPLYFLGVEVEGDLKNRIEDQLDELIAKRAKHGLWEHEKSWGNNRYPEEDSASLKWLGAETVWNLYLLKEYGRIES